MTACSGTQPNTYWPVTTEENGPAFVWAIDFAPDAGGHLVGANKPARCSARAVRSGS